MKKILKWIVIIIFVAFAGIQFVRPNYSNPPVNPAEKMSATVQVPGDVESILSRSCNDCHTNETRYPWYSNIAPMSWSIVQHVDDGRRHLNTSIWQTYDKKKQIKKLDEICAEVSDRVMPMDQYLWLHPEAKISDEDIKKVCEWTEAEIKKLEN